MTIREAIERCRSNRTSLDGLLKELESAFANRGTVLSPQARQLMFQITGLVEQGRSYCIALEEYLERAVAEGSLSDESEFDTSGMSTLVASRVDLALEPDTEAIKRAIEKLSER